MSQIIHQFLFVWSIAVFWSVRTGNLLLPPNVGYAKESISAIPKEIGSQDNECSTLNLESFLISSNSEFYRCLKGEERSFRWSGKSTFGPFNNCGSGSCHQSAILDNYMIRLISVSKPHIKKNNNVTDHEKELYVMPRNANERPFFGL